MERTRSNEDWKTCFAQLGPALLLFARRSTNCRSWNELTFAEIAGILEISQNTAASRYRYALGALKKTLQPHA